jgi:hypothetical protein
MLLSFMNGHPWMITGDRILFLLVFLLSTLKTEFSVNCCFQEEICCQSVCMTFHLEIFCFFFLFAFKTFLWKFCLQYNVSMFELFLFILLMILCGFYLLFFNFKITLVLRNSYSLSLVYFSGLSTGIYFTVLFLFSMSFSLVHILNFFISLCCLMLFFSIH